ncbi:rhomboid family intramembrane serine protease [uncultured Cytophaga sp.]|uniref:rhomboid family intramembrane serine protease n=1 Tax=uncultured Cytophaga sp. TaxID=160238 RepID=UPI00261D2963|nr:rhomboid family intramembrane serine protease [uncultured Cytophaga sp.]
MSLLKDIKAQFYLQDNALIKIILINVLVYIFDCIVWVVSKISVHDIWFHSLQSLQGASSNLMEVAYKPWTILTYAFSHDTPSPLHIFFNMLGLYWFGGLISEYIGGRRLVSLYVIGALFGVALYLVCYNFIPFYASKPPSLLIGASGSVLAAVVGAATLIPTYRFHLIFIGPVKIVYIAAFYVFLSFIGSVQGNAGGNLAHLGGALAGFLFITSLKRGIDLGKPINAIVDFIGSLFSKDKKVRLSFSNNKKSGLDAGYVPDEKEINILLDKISRSGYESLTKEEKQKLFKASQ